MKGRKGVEGVAGELGRGAGREGGGRGKGEREGGRESWVGVD